MNITQPQQTIKHNFFQESRDEGNLATATSEEKISASSCNSMTFPHYCEEFEQSSPRIVIRGVLHDSTPPLDQKTKLDYIKFSCSETLAYARQFLAFHLGELKFVDVDKGNRGYKRQTQFYFNEELVGWFYWLGNREDYKNTILVEITGQGCNLIGCLSQFYSTLKELKSLKVRRLDIALDLFDPLKNWDFAFSQYQNGRMKAKNAPHNPKYKIDHEINPLYRTGRTLYIGDRKHSPKFIRIYEKNLQILSKFRGYDPLQLDYIFKSKSISHKENGKEITNEDFYNWVRYEVEFKDLDTPLNPEMLNHLDSYFAGVNDFFKELVEVGEVKKIKYIPRDKDFEEELAYQNLANQWGSFLQTQILLGKSPLEILKKVLSKSKSKIHQKTIAGIDKETIPYFDIDRYFPPSEWD